MAPIRRYLRITKYSVLEVRIYLDNPSLAHSWLLNPRNPILPGVITAVRPLVLPKLREENERAAGGAKGKGKKKKGGVKDVVVEDDFEVSIFLTDLATRHSLLTKQKVFKDKRGRIKSNSGKLTGWVTKEGMTSEDAIDVEGGGEDAVVIREESDEDENAALGLGVSRNGKRRRDEDEEDSLFIQDEEIDVSEDEGFQPTNKRVRTNADGDGDEEGGEAGEDDKKKLALNTSYDGFSIYGRILCLVVKRRGGQNGRLPGGLADQNGQQMLENWVSTQAAQEGMLDDDA